jgi:hypothetical protein
MSRPLPSSASWRPSGTRALSWVRALDAGSALCLAAAAVLIVWPSTPDVSDANAAVLERTMEPTAGVTTSVATIPGTDSLRAVVINGNVFSASRRAPTTRFVAPGTGAADAVAANSAPTNASMAAPADAGDADALPRLTGIVTLDGERQVLLQLSADDGVPRLYRRGDEHAGYRIERIGADFVVLVHRGSRRTVRLRPLATPDSLEVPQ